MYERNPPNQHVCVIFECPTACHGVDATLVLDGVFSIGDLLLATFSRHSSHCRQDSSAQYGDYVQHNAKEEQTTRVHNKTDTGKRKTDTGTMPQVFMLYVDSALSAAFRDLQREPRRLVRCRNPAVRRRRCIFSTQWHSRESAPMKSGMVVGVPACALLAMSHMMVRVLGSRRRWRPDSRFAPRSAAVFDRMAFYF
jgi:hypothetical protein